MAHTTTQRLRLADDLPAALNGGEIAVLYQPQVAMAGGAIVGVEALARWRHPRHGEVGAERLFVAAERAGLRGEVSDAIHRLALGEAAAWPGRLAGLRLSLNVTGHDILRPGFADALLARAAACGFPARRLTVELTEHDLIADLGFASTMLERLREAGCRVAIDDFGTGYSSLAYLKALPLDALKIDRRMAQDIQGSARDQVVVRGVIAMARALELTVVVEGVETERQRALLAEAGADVYQGFLCSGAVDTAALTRLVEDGCGTAG